MISGSSATLASAARNTLQDGQCLGRVRQNRAPAEANVIDGLRWSCSLALPALCPEPGGDHVTSVLKGLRFLITSSNLSPVPWMKPSPWEVRCFHNWKRTHSRKRESWNKLLAGGLIGEFAWDVDGALVLEVQHKEARAVDGSYELPPFVNPTEKNEEAETAGGNPRAPWCTKCTTSGMKGSPRAGLSCTFGYKDGDKDGDKGNLPLFNERGPIAIFLVTRVPCCALGPAPLESGVCTCSLWGIGKH